MAQQKATNTFTKGMVCDLNELNTANDILVNALNATTGTFNGNEGALQNDMGNTKISLNACLKEGYIPVGSVEYGGIYYIISIKDSGATLKNNNDEDVPIYNCEIGSFPCPNYQVTEESLIDENLPLTGDLLYEYSPLYVGYSETKESIPLNTTYFNFDLEHPVTILAEKSFDGTVNLILTDGKNIPKLINTGFHALANGTYEIIKRFGSVPGNTNRYSLDKGLTYFDLQTSLYRDTSEISNFLYNGTELGGQLKVGNYTFYAITCDKDGNESDIIAESGVISIFKGTDGDPFSVDGGISNETTDKSVSLTISPIDACYHYLKIYYTRATSLNNLNAETLAYKIDNLYQVINKECTIRISGYEETELVSVNDINIQYFNADTAKTAELSLNILFLANVKEKDLNSTEYETLRNLSVLILPNVVLNEFTNSSGTTEDFTFDLKGDYTHSGNNNYYNSEYIYNYTGYHAEEFYRFGIVYIRSDNSLTSVFDILGVDDLNINTALLTITDVDLEEIESKPFLLQSGTTLQCTSNYSKYNAKGVVRFSPSCITNLTDVIGIQFVIPESVTELLLSENHYKGYFFVRQKRIPTVLGLGYVTNICEESYLPSINIPTYGAESEEDTKVPGNTNNKLYLYESFVSGALKNNLETTDFNFYPKRASSKVSASLSLTNNYRSRIFTLSDYTYLYLDKILGSGPVSAFYNAIGNFTDSVFREDSYETVEFSEVDADGKKTTHEFVFVYYMTPEKWDDKGYSDGSKGRTLLVVTDKSNTDVICYIHGFIKVTGKIDIQSYKKILRPTTGENEEKEDAAEVQTATYVSSSTTQPNGKYYYEVTNENGTTTKKYLKVTLDSNGDLDTCTDAETGATVEKDKAIAELGETFTTSEWVSENNWHDFLTYYCDFTGAASMNGNCKNYVLQKPNVNYSYFEATTGYSGKMRCAAKTESYGHTEVLAMIANTSNLQNAGMGLTFYELNNGLDLLLSVDGSYYRPFIAFAGHDSHSLITSVDNIVSQISSYITANESTNTASVSDLLEDPTTPTFDGKYHYCSSVDTDALRIKLHPMQKGAYGLYFPEYELNLSYYNNLFTGQQFKIKPTTKSKLLTVVNNFKDRHYIFEETTINPANTISDCKAISVQEDTTLLMVKKFDSDVDKTAEYTGEIDSYTGEEFLYLPRQNNYFSSKASAATEIGYKFIAGRSLAHINLFTFDDENFANGKVNNEAPFNLARGIYGSYVGVTSPVNIADTIATIYIPGYDIDTEDVKKDYYSIRFNDTNAYQSISNRITLLNNKLTITCFRGDCFINYYTHRVNRNYNDATALYNDTIIEHGSFRKGFEGCFDEEYRTFDLTKDSEAAEAFNVGDLNAVSLGSWVTFPIRSSMNTSLRSSDASYTDEVLGCGHSRTFYPLYSLDAGGSNKIPESSAFNKGFDKSGGDRSYYNLDLNVWINTYYRNRIVYSNVLLHGSLTNGHRVFLAVHYKDYTDLYGEIVKIIDLSGNLLIVCEHGIYLVAINERALAGEGSGGFVYINTSNVLPDNPVIISDTYGSTWPESIIKTPYGVFGVDELSKKIWYTNGTKEGFKILSDFSILKYLNTYLHTNNNLLIGNTNIKTHYNKYKNDVMFTFYDITKDLTTTPDNLWNLCWNINTSSWQTFYSWIPIDSQNIGNNYVSLNLFDDTKYFWKHGMSERVPLLEPILPTNWYGELHPFEFEFIVKEGPEYHKIFDNLKIISNKTAPESFHYEIVGECYDFAKLKENAYYCLEKLKELYSTTENISYDKNYNKIIPVYNSTNFGKQINFPIYYAHQDIKNLIYDNYKLAFANSYDYNYLTGTEVVRDKQKDEYHLLCHAKGVDMAKNGLIRGNMRYKEDNWYVQINPILFILRNTSLDLWVDGAPIFLNDITVDDTAAKNSLIIPDDFKVYVDNQTYNKRHSIKLKDKYIKIRIRYEGNELAIINAINTLYSISYS